MSWLKDMAARIDAFSVRERALIMITVIGGLFLVWNSLLMQPLNARQQALGENIQKIQAELQILTGETQVVVARGQDDPDIETRKQLEALQDEMTQLDATLAQTTENLIEPTKMAGVLERVLNASHGVDVVGLRGLGARPLIEPATQANADKLGAQDDVVSFAYKHGILLELSGGYLETLEVLKDLEALPWTFFWESIELEVRQFPDTRTQIRLFTLSLSADWIGV